MAFRALLFDFDGLILDTETPWVEVWKTIYAEHGHEYPMELWMQIIGGWGDTDFDPVVTLQGLCPAKLDLDALQSRHLEQSNTIILNSPVMAGVRETLADAKRLGLRCAITSSSERAWVEPHLGRLGLLDYFEKIITGDDVQKGRTKPHPDIYLKALSALEMDADQVLVFEDSPNGIKAARGAGLRVVGIPNPITAPLQLQADLVLASLAEVPLEEILRRMDRSRKRQGNPRPLQSAAT